MTNFGPNHYVAALKMKRGEKKALGLLRASASTALTPLFEIVESKGKPIAEHIETGMKDLVSGVAPFPRFFLDAGELEPDGASGARKAFEATTKLNAAYTPVTSPNRFDVATARAHGNGIALRVTRTQLESGSLNRDVSAFLTDQGLVATEVDLILDAGNVFDMVPGGIAQLFAQMMRVLPHIQAWRTLTALACGFPKTMGVVKSGQTEEISRNDWLAWRDELYARRAALKRLPTFGDYAIQNVVGVEGFDPRTMQASAAIRYTLHDTWLIVKGVGTRKTVPTKQFPGLARRLVAHPKFMKASHCKACEIIAAVANGAQTVSSLEVWRRLGTAHHLEVTAAQIAALTWP